MTEKEAEIEALKLTSILKLKHPDIKIHFDLIPQTNEMNISLFWNTISQSQNQTLYKESKTYRIELNEYDNSLKDILVFFE